MSLRARIVATLLVIAVILILPAIVALNALKDVEGTAREFRTRDATGYLALGRLQAALEETRFAHRAYVVLAGAPAESPPPPEQLSQARAETDAGIAKGDSAVARLASTDYREVVPAAAAWRRLTDAIRRERALLVERRLDEAEAFGDSVVTPAFTAAGTTLEPVADAIDQVGLAEVQRAQEVATGAVTTTVLALAAALALTLVVGWWMARAVLRPIHELRRGMVRVAEGDFETEVAIDPGRPDEMGDLARSFRSMTTQLAELDRLKAEVVSVASHEIKTPLSVIRGYVSLLLEGIYGEVSDAQRKTLDAMGEQVQRLTRLVQRLLDVSRFEAGGGRLELREIELRPFLEELAAGFEVLAYQNRIDFTLRIDDDLPATLVGDADRLNEVLGNLLSNAFKFTPQEGRIELHAGRADGGIDFEVADSGVGIPADKISKIFDKFFQIDNEAQPRSAGSGLGLTISQQIVEAHGGTIGAESEVGRGTTFRIHLPARAAGAEPATHDRRLPTDSPAR